MGSTSTHQLAVIVEFAAAVVTFVVLFRVTAPYGRTIRPGWGPTVPSRWGWVVMESPPVFLFGLFFAAGRHRDALVPLVLFGLWQVHYVYRAFIYPFRMRLKNRSMPVVIALIAIAFNALNAYVNAGWIAHFGTYEPAWLTNPQFLVGLAVFLFGLCVNVHSDHVLRALRRPGETGYRVPHGGLHRWVAAPNYLGEVVEWVGWAIMLDAPAGWAFAVYTFANLAPRAVSHRRWYRETFADYPAHRTALIPFVW